MKRMKWCGPWGGGGRGWGAWGGVLYTSITVWVDPTDKNTKHIGLATHHRLRTETRYLEAP